MSKLFSRSLKAAIRDPSAIRDPAIRDPSAIRDPAIRDPCDPRDPSAVWVCATTRGGGGLQKQYSMPDPML